MLGSFSLPSIELMSFWTSSLRYSALKLQMMPWSKGWSLEVVFRARNFTITFFHCRKTLVGVAVINEEENFSFFQYHGFIDFLQPLAKNFTTHPRFSVWFINKRERFHFWKTSLFGWMTNQYSQIFSEPFWFAVRNISTWTLLCLPPLHKSLNIVILFSKHWKKKNLH